MRVVRSAFLCVAVVLASCGHAQHSARAATPTPWTFAPTPTPTPIPTAGLRLAPSPLPWRTPEATLLQRVTAAHLCPDGRVTDALTFRESLYAGCGDGTVLRLTRGLDIIRSRKFGQSNTYLRPAGDAAISVFWTDDGASLVDRLLFVTAVTLKPIMDEPASDSLFLGTIGNRAYIENFCCFGRPDVYEPATIYSISLKDGSASESVDLAPDPQAHPPAAQPLGQGEWNYLIGKYFYVVVQNITYRYDVTNLSLPPVRMKTNERRPL